MIKKFLMKVLGIETAGQKLTRMKVAQAQRKEQIERSERALVRLSKFHANWKGEEDYRQKLAEHIKHFETKLLAARQKYAEEQLLIDMIRATIEAEKSIFA